MARGDRQGQRGQGSGGLSEAQRERVAALVSQTETLAAALREASGDRAGMVECLKPVATAEEPVAAAYAAALGDARGAGAQAAADVAATLGALDVRHEVAREARRSGVRLRSAGVAHALTVPVAAPSAEPPTATPVALTPRKPVFVEAQATRSRDSGEMSLVILWQEGSDREMVRPYLFLLDFWQEGVKDFEISDTMSRGQVERRLLAPQSQRDLPAPVKLGWAQARGLVAQALEVNAWRKTDPAPEFERYRAQVTERLLAEPEDEEGRQAVERERERFAREGDRPLCDFNLEADETLANWLGAWSLGDYGLAYDLMGADHPARRGVTREEFVALRRQWADEAQPAALRLTLIREQEQRASILWTPGAATGRLGGGGKRDLEAFWSLTLKESPVGGQLPELPMGTLVSKDTARHWFWTGHSLQRDPASNMWLVVAHRDEGAQSQGLPVEELTKRIHDLREQAQQTAAAAPQDPNSRESVEALRAVTGDLTTALHYDDALMVKLPLDEGICRDAINDARNLSSHERAAALLERMTGRFQDDVDVRFELGVEQYLVGEQYAQLGQQEAASAWFGRATASLLDAATREPTVRHLQGLGELLARQGHYTQAATRLREAIAAEPSNATLYIDLSETLMNQATEENLDAPEPLTEQQRQEVMRGALDALREVAKIDPNMPRLFTRIGAAQEALHLHEDAVISFEEAIRRDGGDELAYYTLGTLLMTRGDAERARPLLEMASQLEPSSAQFRLALAACYVALERVREATRELDLLDKVAPGLPQVSELRTRLSKITKKK